MKKAVEDLHKSRVYGSEIRVLWDEEHGRNESGQRASSSTKLLRAS